MTKKGTKTPDFEAALADIERILSEMESGDLTLEQSLSHYEKGVELAKLCQSSLQAAQLRITKLTDLNENTKIEQDSD